MIAELTAVAAHRTADQFRLEVRFVAAPGTIEPLAWSYEVEGDAAVTDLSVLPALPAAYVLACRLSQDLRVVEPLPPELHAGARTVGAQLAAWYGWRPAELIAPLAPSGDRRARQGRGRGLLFTRGVDSWGTLLALQAGPRAQRPTHLVAVDGDEHIAPDLRRAAIDDTRTVADQLGLPLQVVRTDVRGALDRHSDWGADTHGAVFAGIGFLLRRSLGRITLSSTNEGELLRSWGSHPDLEPNWSIPGHEVVHHLSREHRWERVARIAGDARVARSLQVCWQGTSPRNCGRCEKCLRTRTTLELLGVGPAFDDRFDVPWDPRLIDLLDGANGQGWCDTLDHCDAVGLEADDLRERWERVPQVPPRGEPPTRRPVQPRISVAAESAPDLEAVGRHLARLGLRIEHLGAPADGSLLRVQRRGRTLEADLSVAGERRPLGPLAQVRRVDLDPLLVAMAVDPEAIAPFGSHRRAPRVGPHPRR